MKIKSNYDACFQIGKAFSILGILQALLPVVTKPAFAILYQVHHYHSIWQTNNFFTRFLKNHFSFWAENGTGVKKLQISGMQFVWNCDIFQNTLKVFPATYLIVVSAFYTGVLAILIYTHFGLKVFNLGKASIEN